MAIPTAREALDDGSPDGCRVRGLAIQVIDPTGTARTLLVGESGALCVYATAAGQAFTLPAIIDPDDVGWYFDFVATITGTGTYSVATDAATTFIGGGLDSSSTAVAEGGDTFPADRTATVACTHDTDVTGRLNGTHYRLTALSSTIWSISGTMMGVGTLATPF